MLILVKIVVGLVKKEVERWSRISYTLDILGRLSLLMFFLRS